MPVLGLGTWKSKPGEVAAAVRTALEAGYRHVDCAPIYGNENEVGEGLAAAFEGDLSRDDVWVTSKLWCDSQRPEHVVPALRKTLSDLGLDHLDLYLIHWPVAYEKGVTFPTRAEHFISREELPVEETWGALERAVEGGLCRHIGVSNFGAPLVEQLLRSSQIRPEVLQVELHPHLQQRDLLGFCRDHDVFVTAYSPLGSPDRPARMKAESEPSLLDNDVIRDIAGRHDASPAQVLIRWAIQRGTSVIPKSVDSRRIRENLAAADLELSDDDMARIAQLDRGFRYIDGKTWEVDGGPYSAEAIFHGLASR